MMKVYKNGKRYDSLKLYENLKHSPYDYERHGLIRHLMSKIIYNTNNPITKFMIDMFDKEFVFILKYTDKLANFTNICHKNR